MIVLVLLQAALVLGSEGTERHGLSNSPVNVANKPVCEEPCQNGDCVGDNICLCYETWIGQYCTESKYLSLLW